MRPERSSQARRRGFTFLEVMVALTVFAFAGLVLASACLNFLNAQQAGLRHDTGALERRLVREALCAEATLAKVTTWNQLALPEGRTARWRAVVAPTTVADLFEVTLEIEYTDPAGQSTPVAAETFRLLRPTWSQPADRQTLRAAARSKLARRTYQ